MKLIPSYQVKNSLFFTEGDPVQQKFARIGMKTLERKIKIATLLSGTVIIPTSHLLESRKTFSILIQSPNLLHEGIIIPSLPEQFTSFGEYIQEKYIKSGSSQFHSRVNQYELYVAADFLGKHSRAIILRNDKAMRDYYKYSLIKDLSNQDSLLSRSLQLPSNNVNDLLNEIYRIEPMSRESAFALAERLGPKKSIFIAYLQSLYCITGSRGNNSDPMLHPSILPFLKDRIARVSSQYDPRVFSFLAKKIGISEVILDRIPLSDFAALSKQRAIKNFRKKLSNIIEQARKGLVETLGEEYEEETFQNVILDVLGKEIAEETERMKRSIMIKRIWRIASFSTTLLAAGLSTATGDPIASRLATVSGTVNVLDTLFNITDPLLDEILKQGTEIIGFSSYIREFSGIE